EPFEVHTSDGFCCEECTQTSDRNRTTPVRAEVIPARSSASSNYRSGNRQTNKILDAISQMSSESAPDEINDGFLEDIKTILTDPKTLQEHPVQQSIPPLQPVQTRDEDIFDKIARNMQYANSYDFGTLELENRFDEFDKQVDQRPPNINRRATSQSIQTVALQQPANFSSAEFLEDLDIISSTPLTKYGHSHMQSNDQEIPLDPGIGGRSIIPAALQEGDIILSTTANDSISRAIRSVTGSEISHASIYVGNGNVIHATLSGVSQWTLSDLMSASTLCVAYHHKDMDDSKAARIVKFLTNALNSNKGFDSWGLINAAPSQLLASYCDSLSGATKQACLHGARSIKPGTDNNGQFFCSELIFAALNDAGLTISTVQPSFSSPQEAVRLFYDGTLDYVGHLKV
ncbi:MAG: hypothetical protein EOO02_21615, partial [Chitinophagaceae bacterium]